LNLEGKRYATNGRVVLTTRKVSNIFAFILEPNNQMYHTKTILIKSGKTRA